MRYCVSGRQPYSVLKRADEIKVAYADRDRILDFVEKLPDKVIILELPGDAEYEWPTWEMYSEKFNEFYIASHRLDRFQDFQEHNIKWYWPYPITSFYELSMIMDLDPSYVMVGPPLSFDLDKVFDNTYYKDSTNQCPVRMVVNNALPQYLITDKISQGFCSQWVRPEDTQLYSTRVQCFEFENIDLKQEEIYLHIYKENKMWPGNLNLLIQNLNFNVDNRALPQELGQYRMNCGQKCFITSSCHACESAFKFAEAIRKEHEKREQYNNIDNN